MSEHTGRSQSGPSPDDVRRSVMDLRLNYITEHVGVQPTRVVLSPSYAQALLDWLLDEMPPGDDRDKVREQGLAGIYGGSLYGMKIERADEGEAPSVYGTYQPLSGGDA